MGDDENAPYGKADFAADRAPVTEEETPETSELEAQKKQYDELNDRFLRLAADFDNFRKRTIRERENTIRFANERFAVDMLEVADNLERALTYDTAHLREGLVQIRELCSSVLQRHSILPIDTQGKKFDPAEHEAVAHIPSDQDEGMIIDEIAKGYRMHDKVIRYAKVAVSKGNENRISEE